MTLSIWQSGTDKIRGQWKSLGLKNLGVGGRNEWIGEATVHWTLSCTCVCGPPESLCTPQCCAFSDSQRAQRAVQGTTCSLPAQWLLSRDCGWCGGKTVPWCGCCLNVQLDPGQNGVVSCKALQRLSDLNWSFPSDINQYLSCVPWHAGHLNRPTSWPGQTWKALSRTNNQAWENQATNRVRGLLHDNWLLYRL